MLLMLLPFKRCLLGVIAEGTDRFSSADVLTEGPGKSCSVVSCFLRSAFFLCALFPESPVQSSAYGNLSAVLNVEALA